MLMSVTDVGGFFFREEPTYSPPLELKAFLDSGPPPIYVGFGSIVASGSEGLLTTILNAARAVRVRVVISQGWSNLGGENSLDVFFIGDCPHEWLFPRVAAVVHHGGAGTTACGLRYGKPTTIIPFFGEYDQPALGDLSEGALTYS
jgi:UDP:flavonoid glycosyltransferase YjiC (YdhE family)